jgi:hypothetical protein
MGELVYHVFMAITSGTLSGGYVYLCVKLAQQLNRKDP